MKITGIVGYLLSPCKANGEIDNALLAAHVNQMIDAGVHGVAPLGSVGCLPYLSDAERDEVVSTTVQAAAGRVPVLVGISSLSTAHTIRHARFAEAQGAAALQLLPSTYWQLTENELLRYFQTVAESVSIPIMAYNNPFTTGWDMPVPLLQKITSIPNITMVKEASPNPEKIPALRKACGDRVDIFVGVSKMAQSGFAAGAKGWCTAAPNVCAAQVLNFYRCVVAGDWEGAALWLRRQEPLLNQLLEYGLPRAVSAGLEIRGMDAGHLRAPLLPLTAQQRAALQKTIVEMETTQ